MILAGEKNVTWRLFDDKDLSVGDQVSLMRWETGEPFATAELSAVRAKLLGELKAEDYEGHERFSSDAEMVETYRRYYGPEVGATTEVKIISLGNIRPTSG